ncbi:hypothetical protein BKP42_24000 [Rhodococcus erythropolis]|nr:hypothetical protein BKP42_24000 [Rhodococcus erythropolis]
MIVGAYKSYSLRNARASGQCDLDFAEFDTEPTDLDLEVAAAHVLHRATVDPPDHITRAVQPLTGRPERVRDKTTRCQCRLSQVSTSDLNTRHVQLTRDTNRNGLQAAVQDPRGHTPNRAADVHAVKRGQRITDVRRDRRLRRTVRIEESTHTAVREWNRPLGNERPRTGFATDDNHPQRVEPTRIHRCQSSGRHERMGHALRAHDLGQFRAAVHRRRRNHHCRCRSECHQQLENGSIETRRCEMERPSIISQRIALDLLGTEIRHTGIGDHNALGQTRGAGGVDDVGRLPLVDRTASIRITHRRARFCRARRRCLLVVENNPRQRRRQSCLDVTEGKTQHRTGIGNHVGNTVNRIRRVDGHECSTRFRHCPQGENRIGRTRNRDRDPILRPDALRNQNTSELRRPLVEFAVADRFAVEVDRVRRRIHSGRRCEDLDQGSRDRLTSTNIGQRTTLSRIENVDVTDDNRGTRYDSL